MITACLLLITAILLFGNKLICNIIAGLFTAAMFVIAVAAVVANLL